MFSIQNLASEFGTHDDCIENWINNLKIVQDELVFALEHFNKAQRRRIMTEKLRPAAYLIDHPELINHVQHIGEDFIKSLPKNVFEQHLEALKVADAIDDKINNRSYPYHSYDADVFTALRHSTKRTDITFVRRLFTRSISHHSYSSAIAKLSALSRTLSIE